MFKKYLFALVCSFVISVLLFNLPALADVTYDDVKVNLPIENNMEPDDTLPILESDGSAELTQDRVQGDYAVKVSAVSTADSVEYSLAEVQEDFVGTPSIAQYSKIKLWVKPGPKAQWIKFSIRYRTSYSLLTCDQNGDGIFEVGKDLISGKWNEIVLDLTKHQDSITEAEGLKAETNGNSSEWYFDSISSVEASTISLNLAEMANSKTIKTNEGLQFNPDTNGKYDITPTILTADSQQFHRVDTTQNDF
ncbi:MAG: hypothetical protein H6Q64_686 [Firmicutes bacterium]|nr:hypothetical protein [Bacillota bacterium]